MAAWLPCRHNEARSQVATLMKTFPPRPFFVLLTLPADCGWSERGRGPFVSTAMSKQHSDHGEAETMEREGEDLLSLGKDLMQMVEELENLVKARRSLGNDVVAARHSLAKERYSSLDSGMLLIYVKRRFVACSILASAMKTISNEVLFFLSNCFFLDFIYGSMICS